MMRKSGSPSITKILSGGQTGVDRAGLDAAMTLGISIGGWCPKGRRAEDGKIPAKYPLIETDTPSYMERTELNIRDSDGTLVILEGKPSGGTAFTIRAARKKKRPLLKLASDDLLAEESFLHWIEKNSIKTLNVAGPRESSFPGITRRTRIFLIRLFRKAR